MPDPDDPQPTVEDVDAATVDAPVAEQPASETGDHRGVAG